MRRTTRPFLSVAVPALLLTVAVGTVTVAVQFPAAAAGTALSARTTKSSDPLAGPRTSPAEDNLYLADVTKADQALIPYVQKRGNVALRALLTDGAAFCAFLSRGGASTTR